MTELLHYSFPSQMCNITIKIVARPTAIYPFQQKESFLTRLHGIDYDEQITHVLSSNERVIEPSQVVPVLNKVSRDFLYIHLQCIS